MDESILLAARWAVWAVALVAAAVISVYHATLVPRWLRTRSAFPRPVLFAGFVLFAIAWAALPVTRARFTWPTRAVILSEGLVWLLVAEPLLYGLRRRAGWTTPPDDAPPE